MRTEPVEVARIRKVEADPVFPACAQRVPPGHIGYPPHPVGRLFLAARRLVVGDFFDIGLLPGVGGGSLFGKKLLPGPGVEEGNASRGEGNVQFQAVGGQPERVAFGTAPEVYVFRRTRQADNGAVSRPLSCFRKPYAHDVFADELYGKFPLLRVELHAVRAVFDFLFGLYAQTGRQQEQP